MDPIATEYTICASLLPEDDINRHLGEVQLRRRPGGRWVVFHNERYLNGSGEWDWLTGEDDLDLWRKKHWLDWDLAVRLAQAEAAKLAARYNLT